MLAAPTRQEIDPRTLKLIVGLVAASLAGLTNVFAESPIASISASYYEAGWSQSIFIGFLFAIAAFLLAYNGLSLNRHDPEQGRGGSRPRSRAVPLQDATAMPSVVPHVSREFPRP